MPGDPLSPCPLPPREGDKPVGFQPWVVVVLAGALRPRWPSLAIIGRARDLSSLHASLGRLLSRFAVAPGRLSRGRTRARWITHGRAHVWGWPDTTAVRVVAALEGATLGRVALLLRCSWC